MSLLTVPSQCCLVGERIKELGSSSVRQWKRGIAGPSWVRRRHHGTARTGICSHTSSSRSFQLWEAVEVQWWKLRCWAPHPWVLGLVIPSNHSMPCYLQTAVPGSWPQLHRRTAAGKFIAHAEPVLKDNFLTIVASFAVFSTSSACRCSICKGRWSMAGSPQG